MCLNALEEWYEIVIGIAEIIQFINSLAVRGHIDFVFGTSVSKGSENVRAFIPTMLFYCKFIESIDLDSLAIRCSRKRLN